MAVTPNKSGVFGRNATRQYTPGGVGNMQSIHDFRFSTRNFAAAVFPSLTVFFNTAPSPDFTVDRYSAQNNLVDSGQKWLIHQVSVAIFPQAPYPPTATLQDMVNVINLCAIRFQISSKEYGLFPLLDLPAGGGPNVSGSQVAITAAAAPGATSPYGITNGVAQRLKLALCQPLEIQGNQAFYMELLGPSATTFTLTGPVTLRVELEGEWFRPAA
jgi:hypothetical protein